MGPDLRCGNEPCGEFVPHRYFVEKNRTKVPYGCKKSTVFTVLGTTNCNDKKCIEFQTLAYDYAGLPFWWRTQENEGRVKCLENKECKDYYRELACGFGLREADTKM